MEIEIITECPICHELHTVIVKVEDYFDWCNGKGTYEAFPYLSANERELLITGVCPKCWDAMMPAEEDEDEEDEEEER